MDYSLSGAKANAERILAQVERAAEGDTEPKVRVALLAVISELATLLEAGDFDTIRNVTTEARERLGVPRPSVQTARAQLAGSLRLAATIADRVTEDDTIDVVAGSPAKRQILALTSELGPITHAALAERAEIADSTLSYHMSQLVPRGLIRRVKRDKRSVYDTTARGRRVVKAMAPVEFRRPAGARATGLGSRMLVSPKKPAIPSATVTP